MIYSFFIKQVAFPAMEILKGNRIRHYLKDMKQSQSLNKHCIINMQEAKLQKLLMHCITYIPAYLPYSHLKEMILKDPFQALKKFSVLHKSEFSKNSENYLRPGISLDKLILNKSGGSTREPVAFYLDRYTVEHYEAARWRGLSWWDINYYDRSVMLWSSPNDLSKLKYRKFILKERFLKNRIILPSLNLTKDDLAAQIQMIKDFKPKYIYGYASSLFFLSKYIIECGIDLRLDLKGIVSTAEMLYDNQREVIEKAFKCKVINEYGARDAGIIAYKCPSGTMHLSSENLYLEIVDINTHEDVGYGESGAIVVTDLNNFSMPRLRYFLGDIGIKSEKPCNCGINLPSLENILGREDGIFVTKSGRYINTHLIGIIARDMKGIRKYRIIQHSPESITIKLCKENDECNADEFISIIREYMENAEVKVEFCEDIPDTQSGKIINAIREFPLDSFIKKFCSLAYIGGVYWTIEKIF